MFKSFIGVQNVVKFEAMRNQKLGINLVGLYKPEQHCCTFGIHQTCSDRNVAIPQILQMQIHLSAMDADVGNDSSWGNNFFAKFKGGRNAYRLDGSINTTLTSQLHQRIKSLA